MKKCLFVVDDDPSVRESLKKVLEESGYDVVLGADGREAESRLHEPGIDLLILDLNMPDRDGWDVLEEVVTNRPFLPVIVVTGMMNQLASMTIPGVAALLQKPVDVAVILKRIEELLAETPEARLRRIFGSIEMEPWWRHSAGSYFESANSDSFNFQSLVRRTGRSSSK